MTATIAQDALCLLLCAAATITDIKSYRIPNWLTVGGICCGLALNSLLLANGWLIALGGGLLTGVVFGILGAIRFVGMGDVKLMVAVGALLGLPMAAYALVYVGFAGGIVALAYALARGELSSVFRNLGRLAKETVGRRNERPDAALHRIPYAIAILIGTACAVAARYFPAWRL